MPRRLQGASQLIDYYLHYIYLYAVYKSLVMNPNYDQFVEMHY